MLGIWTRNPDPADQPDADQRIGAVARSGPQRDRGFADDDQEGADGLRGVAAPVFNAQVAGGGSGHHRPGFPFGLSDAQRAGALVRAAAEAVTDGIGGTAP